MDQLSACVRPHEQSVTMQDKECASEKGGAGAVGV
jgi:hypothetical protein